MPDGIISSIVRELHLMQITSNLLSLLMRRYHVFLLRMTTEISNGTRNVLLVVAVLLVTVSFQTAVNPPGGVWQDNYLTNNTSPNNSSGEYLQHPHHAGTAIMGKPFFHVLVYLNSISFFLTVYIIYLLIPCGFRILFSLLLYTLSLHFIASLCITSPNSVPAGLSWIWNNFDHFWLFSALLFKVFEVIVFFRGYKLTEAFLPRK
jgi:hypothetical protein